MSMRSLENAICSELRKIARNPKIRVKDMLEWSTGEITLAARKLIADNEVIIVLPHHGVSVAILKALDKR